jgi:hypothetical protein
VAVDYAGNTVSNGDQCVLAGVVRAIEGDLLLMTVGDGRHAMRVKSTDALRVGGIAGGSSSQRTTEVAFWQGSGLTWANMPADPTILFGATHVVRRRDLTGFTQVRLMVVQAAPAASGAKIRLRYASTLTTTYGSTTQIGDASDVDVALSSSTATSTASAWFDLASGAIGDVFLVPFGVAGDLTADPSFWYIVAEFR